MIAPVVAHDGASACRCDLCPGLDPAAPPPMPATLPPEVRGYVTGQPDALLVSWFQLSPQAVDVLSERERTHALGLLTGERLAIYKLPEIGEWSVETPEFRIFTSVKPERRK